MLVTFYEDGVGGRAWGALWFEWVPSTKWSRGAEEVNDKFSGDQLLLEQKRGRSTSNLEHNYVCT